MLNLNDLHVELLQRGGRGDRGICFCGQEQKKQIPLAQAGSE